MEEVKEKRAPSFVQRTVQFLKEVRQEIERVTWPSRTEVRGATVVVIIVVLLIGFFIGLVDKLLTLLNDWLLF